MEKNIGIWLDSDQAIIIENGKESIDRIASGIEHYNLKGGTKGGGLAGTSDTKLLERKKNQSKKYFENILSKIPKVDTIVLFGPGETKFAFKKEIENHNTIKDKLLGIETTDSNMSNNQLFEWVREYYSKSEELNQ